MGQKNTKKNKPNIIKNEQSLGQNEKLISKGSFEYISIIGKGGFGKVWKVVSKRNKKLYALKEMSKCKIIDKKSEKSIKYERDLLSRMNHP